MTWRDQSRDGDTPQKPSRTRKKKAALAAQRLGEKLLGLSHDQLDALDLPPEVAAAVDDARSMRKHGARRRQLQYIGALMRTVDLEDLSRRMEQVTYQGYAETKRFKQAEQWRDELIAGDRNRLVRLVSEFPEIEMDLLERLIADAVQAPAETERRKAGKALFRYLRGLL